MASEEEELRPPDYKINTDPNQDTSVNDNDIVYKVIFYNLVLIFH